MSKVKSQVDYVLLFDESLNSELHSKQVDIHIRFWDRGQVNTRYLTLEFIGHGAVSVCCWKLAPHFNSTRTRPDIEYDLT